MHCALRVVLTHGRYRKFLQWVQWNYTYYSRYCSSEAWICWWNPDLKLNASLVVVDFAFTLLILWLVGSRIARTA